MNEQQIIDQLEQNSNVFKQLFANESEVFYRWKANPDKWCLLEILCHLYDEEIEDFRARVKYSMETPELSPPPIDPEGWVSQRNYLDKDYHKMLDQLLVERAKSVEWLRQLKSPKWENAHIHPTLGKRSARFYLANWLAHDYLHIRQIMNLKLNYCAVQSGEDLTYAGGD